MTWLSKLKHSLHKPDNLKKEPAPKSYTLTFTHVLGHIHTCLYIHSDNFLDSLSVFFFFFKDMVSLCSSETDWPGICCVYQAVHICLSSAGIKDECPPQAGEMAHWFRALTILPKVLSSTPI